MKKPLILSVFLLVFLGSVLAQQPKILEVEDNFGNTYEFNPEEGIAQARYGEEFVVEDDAQITLCASEVRKEEDENVKFSFSSNLDVQHPQSVDDNCFTWDISRSDYKDSWWLDVQVSNQDDISYADYGDIDHIARLTFSELVLPEDDSSSQTTKTYDNMMISRSEYENLQEEAESPNLEEYQTIVNEQEYQNLRDEVENKTQRIAKLENTISDLRSKTSELESTVQTLNETQKDTQESENGSILGFLGF